MRVDVTTNAEVGDGTNKMGKEEAGSWYGREELSDRKKDAAVVGLPGDSDPVVFNAIRPSIIILTPVLNVPLSLPSFCPSFCPQTHPTHLSIKSHQGFAPSEALLLEYRSSSFMRIVQFPGIS